MAAKAKGAGDSVPARMKPKAIPATFNGAAPDTENVRYDVVCNVEHVLWTDLEFGVAEQRAIEHNTANDQHNAVPIRRRS